MSQETQLARPGLPHSATDAGWALAARRAGDDGQQPQPLHKMHRLLRGRYLLAISLSLVLAVILAAAGYFLPKPQYRSDGIIEIKPNIPSLGDTTIVMPLYSQYIESQVNSIQTQRVIMDAMQSEEWRPFSHGLDPKAMRDFIQALEVEYIRGSFLIRVSFTDKDPSRAQAAVKAIVRSYLDKFGEEDTQDLRMKSDYVDNMLQRAMREKQQLQDQLISASSIYGTQDLAELHSARVREMIALETQLTDSNIALTSAQVALGQAAGKPAAATQPSPAASMTLSQIANASPRVANYMLQRDQAADELDKLRQRLGRRHPLVQEAEKHFDEVESRLQQAADEFRAETGGLAVSADGKTNTAVTPQMVHQLEQKRDFLNTQVEAARKEVADIGNVRVKIESLQSQIKDYEDKITEARHNQEQLNVQLAMNGRIRVQSYGDKPVIPAIDRRRQAAVLGFLGGLSLPFLVLMLVGLADKRYRYSDEANTELSGVPLLGILPNLPDLLTDPQQAAIAAHCVHQIRTLLQVGVRTQDRHVYAITSAAPGDGKTSLTLALGLSFAASGSRTLLIDCDLVGGSLTRRLGVNTPEGMLEAMASRSPLDFVRDTDVADLSILPVGSATMLHAGSFSPAGLRRLVAEARKAFDIVLIDTGPILGSIEAPPVAASADATILCVSRGQQRPAVERSMHHLLAIGAKLAGLVFNRAEARDFERSVSRFSQRSIRPTADYARAANGSGTGSLRLPAATGKTDPESAGNVVDPVTRAVASDFKGENGNDPR